MPDPRSGLPQPGDRFADKFTIVRVVGEGAVGVVYEARHERLGRAVALKVMRAEVRGSDEWRARFEREARAAVTLRGPNVARVLDVDTAPDGTPFLVMELLSGHDLAHELNARGRLPVADAVDLVLQACAAMAEAHAAGIVHRDLTPRNLFLAEEDGLRVLKVLDFGISKILSERTDITAGDAAFGTPSYVSPEQIRASCSVDARSDVWSLGVILYELLTATTPFQGRNAAAVVASIVSDEPKDLRVLRPDVPKRLAAAVMRALTKDPDARFATAADFAAEIAPFGSAELEVGPRSGPHSGPRSGPFAKTTGNWAKVSVTPPRAEPRRRWIAASVGAGALVAAIAAAVLIGQGSPSTGEAAAPAAVGEGSASAPATAAAAAAATATATAPATATAAAAATATASVPASVPASAPASAPAPAAAPATAPASAPAPAAAPASAPAPATARPPTRAPAPPPEPRSTSRAPVNPVHL